MCSLCLKKLLDNREVNTVQLIFLTTAEKGEKKSYIGGVCLYAVFGQTPFGDEIVEKQLVSGRELFGESGGFDGASVVNLWLLFPGM